MQGHGSKLARALQEAASQCFLMVSVGSDLLCTQPRSPSTATTPALLNGLSAAFGPFH